MIFSSHIQINPASIAKNKLKLVSDFFIPETNSMIPYLEEDMNSNNHL